MGKRALIGWLAPECMQGRYGVAGGVVRADFCRLRNRREASQTQHCQCQRKAASDGSRTSLLCNDSALEREREREGI